MASYDLVPTARRGVWMSQVTRRASWPLRTIRQFFKLFDWVRGVIVSAIIVSVLFFIVINFYIFSSLVNLESFFYIFLILSVATDGIYVLLHIFRRKVDHQHVAFDPKKLTVLICCYNGQDVIEETIKQAKKHVPSSQIIVISDASTDDTVAIAKRQRVRVVENTVNLNKPLSISRAIPNVHTPYVLLLDDDTLIGETFIPTSLLDDGYTAVAFNVMPKPEKTLLNYLQRFEYRMSMQLGKNLRGEAGAIGNVSGAIGLYRTKDLEDQSERHSGQFAGEDEQRTLLSYFGGKGKGITYTDSLVLTQAPQTFTQLFRQRAFSWSAAVPELFTMYWKILLQPHHHFLLKVEKGYQLYVYLTDPLRMLFFWALFFRPSNILITFAFYLLFNVIIWLRMGMKDQFSTVVFFPIYSLGLVLCRFVGHFYWIKVKLRYLSQRLHRHIKKRRVLPEYALLGAVFIFMWGFSIQHFTSDLRLFSKIRTHKLEETVKTFEYESVENPGAMAAAKQAVQLAGTESVVVMTEKGDTPRAVAHKAVDAFVIQEGAEVNVTESNRWKLDEYLAKSIQTNELEPNSTVVISKSEIRRAIEQVNSAG